MPIRKVPAGTRTIGEPSWGCSKDSLCMDRLRPFALLLAAIERLRRSVQHSLPTEVGLRLHCPRRRCRDPEVRVRVPRMIQPDALKRNEPLLWSPGTGTDVWEMFCAAIQGDLAAIKRVLERDASLVRCHYAYRTPLYF